MLEVTSPYTGERIGEVRTDGAEDIEDALAGASRLFADRDRWLAVHERVAILDRLADIMAERQEELARQAAAEGGKPLLDSRAEAARAVDGVRLAIETIRTEAGEVIPLAGTARTGKSARLLMTPRSLSATRSRVSAAKTCRSNSPSVVSTTQGSSPGTERRLSA